MTTLKNLPMVSVGTVLIALGTSNAVQAAQFFGSPQPLGENFVRSFVILDDDEKPLEVGVILTQGALSLPTSDTAPNISTVLSLPSEASDVAVNHFELTYRPHGFPGLPEVLGVPRFTIDSFLISPQERALICPYPDTTGSVATCTPDELAQVLTPPQPGVVPPGLQPTGIVSPGIGARYFDPDVLLPILTQQQPFTTLYDYAFFNGQASVIGFGATKAFLETQSNVTKPIKVPSSYTKSGYYPTEYSVTFDPTSQEYKMVLGGLTYRSVPEISPRLGLVMLGLLGVVFECKKRLAKI
ncbi:DUF5602 domain-containing protein [Funiculus sociatus GB2-A5]|uniref:DUF5602 domain-containing protein n=1 Tax=Funiculus sociatus GB2-A5 TaxID=2933946 RepID=A0ABV0JV90_9CYAN|nr:MULTISPECIES: DUF5602 domain-containing protein [unclassified Trichocoleus]MBD1903928.1 DUF5602 domain-containing protein [Trichocoleus sp. FACHB-832]MBD2060797.1 DUF5602 domain-containing protein [Trichocoleus sp. FACHB-6]